MIYFTCNRIISLEAGTRCALPVDAAGKHDGPCSCLMTIDLGHFGKHTFNYDQKAEPNEPNERNDHGR